MSEQLDIGPGTSLRVISHSEELLELEATYAPGSSPPPAHLHPSQDERFELLQGTLQTAIHGQRSILRTGELLEVPRGTAHQMWNESDDLAVVNWKTLPAGRTLDWFGALAGLLSGKSQADGAALLAEYADVFRLAEE